MFQRAFGRIAYQTARITHFVHNLIARVDTGGAADTLVLHTVADVDADGADLDAHRTVDAVAQTRLFLVDRFLAGCAVRRVPRHKKQSACPYRTSRFGNVRTDTYAGTLFRA